MLTKFRALITKSLDTYPWKSMSKLSKSGTKLKLHQNLVNTLVIRLAAVCAETHIDF